ncbi:PEP-CTERM sorting domain-containing protein [Roseofilum sp. BLCC_M154]|uniref:PEP-CTERM sorting domain-containing protein n=1 Tax=Roseofilum acuticapitatum BLCC-M154 TaxID=3022444 RepID=A0ABT7AP61_9CYAN|nr:PEP-CTERM sorting domain-containing protein [Roseofilum acuticapitatum]MDJ1168677.1 PEP-CTERM sorting domain-containing protein [Roseofilum acuticapitatum BLCC-M154]
MKKLIKSALTVGMVTTSAAAISVGFAGNAKAATLDFEGFSSGEIISGDAFSDLGVIFDQDLEVFTGIGVLPQSGINTVSDAASLGGNLSGFFTTAVDFISVFAGDNGGDTDTVTLLGFDEFDNLVASDTFTDLAAQTLSISGSGITRFEINQVGLIAIDDFTFNPTTQSVPEPSLLLGSLMALAAGATGLKRKR